MRDCWGALNVAVARAVATNPRSCWAYLAHRVQQARGSKQGSKAARQARQLGGAAGVGSWGEAAGERQQGSKASEAVRQLGRQQAPSSKASEAAGVGSWEEQLGWAAGREQLGWAAGREQLGWAAGGGRWGGRLGRAAGVGSW